MQFRVMEESDIRRVIPLYISHYNGEGDEWTEEIVYKRIHQVWSREDSLCLIAELEGEVAGFCMGSFEEFFDLSAYNLEEILMAHPLQNQGLGTRFMEELERRVKALGGAMIQLCAVNDPFHEHFYGKLNYQTCTNLVLKSKFL